MIGINIFNSLITCTTRHSEPGQRQILTSVRFFAQGFLYSRGGLAPKIFFIDNKIELTEILQIGFFPRRFEDRRCYVCKEHTEICESLAVTCESPVRK